jgi:hypothetical protein
MGILEFILLALALGVIVWAIQSYAPIPAAVKTVILVAVVLFLVLVLLRAMGIFSALDAQIPRVR